MNTIDIARDHLTEQGAIFDTVEGDGWTAFVVRYGDEQLRVWANDAEADLHIAFANVWGEPKGTGEVATTNAPEALIRAALDLMIGELFRLVDGM